MEDQLDLELGQNALEHAPVENRSGHLPVDLPGNARIERGEVERHDRAVGTLGESIDQAMTNLAVGPGDEHDRFTHAANYTGRHAEEARCEMAFSLFGTVFAVGSAGAGAPYEFIEILVNDKTLAGAASSTIRRR